jgi:sugar phosphate permease
VLAVGALATAALAAAQSGLAALTPAIQTTFDLTLVQVTTVLTAFGGGTVLTVLAWGILADRTGERIVIAAGLGAGSVALMATAAADGYGALLAGVATTGMLAASAAAASGRAIFGWFPRDERGLALGLRQTAVPVGAAAAAFSLPPLAAAFSLDTALAVLAGAMLVAALASSVWLREAPPRASAAPPAPPARRDPRVWRLSAASALMMIGQIGVTSLIVLYLHDERGFSPTAAAVALGVVHLGGAVARTAAGRWSDVRDERIEPFRILAGAAGLLLLAEAALSDAPDALAVPLLMAGGVAAMSWNGLSFTAVAEIAGRRQAGQAMGIQNTAMRLVGAAVPVTVGALAAAASWHAAFALMGVAPLASRFLLRPLVDDEHRRRRARRRRVSEAAASGRAPTAG